MTPSSIADDTGRAVRYGQSLGVNAVARKLTRTSRKRHRSCGAPASDTPIVSRGRAQYVRCIQHGPSKREDVLSSRQVACMDTEKVVHSGVSPPIRYVSRVLLPACYYLQGCFQLPRWRSRHRRRLFELIRCKQSTHALLFEHIRSVASYAHVSIRRNPSSQWCIRNPVAIAGLRHLSNVFTISEIRFMLSTDGVFRSELDLKSEASSLRSTVYLRLNKPITRVTGSAI